MKNKVLIYGITGQDGSYLAKLLLEKKFIVHGISRKKINWDKNLKQLDLSKKIKVFCIDKKFNNLNKILKNNYKFIFFLGGQSSPLASFKLEHQTLESNIIPLKIILEFIKNQKRNRSKFMFSSSSEIFGDQKKQLFNENSKKKPQSPYALTKLIGYEIVKSYRSMFNLPVFSIIFFNHESILRGEKFIFKKISNYIKRGNYSKKVKLGNLNIKRDWGSSEEYMKITYKIINSKIINDYILATGQTTKLQNIIKLFFKKKGMNYLKYIKTDKKFFRKFDIKENFADIKKLKKMIKTFPKQNYKNLIDLF